MEQFVNSHHKQFYIGISLPSGHRKTAKKICITAQDCTLHWIGVHITFKQYYLGNNPMDKVQNFPTTPPTLSQDWARLYRHCIDIYNSGYVNLRFVDKIKYRLLYAFFKGPFESKSLCWKQPYFCIFLVEPAIAFALMIFGSGIIGMIIFG